MIQVVDAIMGAGKTSAAITFMKKHAHDRRFLYITPYLEETERIKTACEELHFVCPSDHAYCNDEYVFTKSSHLLKLIESGRNVAMTHELYCGVGLEHIDAIASGNYTIIIDEVVDVFRKPEYSQYDLDMAVACGYLVPDKERSTDSVIVYMRSDKEYANARWRRGSAITGGLFYDMFKMADSRRLISSTNVDNTQYYCWMLHRELFTSSVDTFVMTYLFEGSMMCAYFKMNNLKYEKIGVVKCPDGVYRFASEGMMPEMAKHLRDYITILDHKKMNAVGDDETALSANWYLKQKHLRQQAEAHASDSSETDAADIDDPELEAALVDENIDKSKPVKLGDGIDRLRKNMISYYKNYCDSAADERMWCTFKSYVADIKDKGFNSCYVSWNARATNKFSDRTGLAFLVNVYMNPALPKFLEGFGVTVDAEKYALSALIQWMWRSSLRNGKSVKIYLPSSRMRRLLNEWMDSLADTGNAQLKAS